MVFGGYPQLRRLVTATRAWAGSVSGWGGRPFRKAVGSVTGDSEDGSLPSCVLPLFPSQYGAQLQEMLHFGGRDVDF